MSRLRYSAFRFKSRVILTWRGRTFVLYECQGRMKRFKPVYRYIGCTDHLGCCDAFLRNV